MKKPKLELMFHVVLGYPSLAASVRLITELCRRDIQYLEIQVPFSDPMADGPLITMANGIAIKQGVSIVDAIRVIELNRGTTTKLVLMSYFQPIFKADVSQVALRLNSAGGFGCIVPDLPVDQPEVKLLTRSTVEYIPVFSPGMSADRIRLYKSIKPKLAYCTARRGITGSQSQLDSLKYIKEIKTLLDCKIVLGFGIQSPDQLKALPPYVDGVVVGSKIIEMIEDNHRQLGPALKFVDDFIAIRNKLSSVTITTKEKYE